MNSEELYAKLEKAYFSENPDEADLLRDLPKMLAGVRHFVDIGASLGQYTKRANEIMRNGRIDAYEADPVRVTRLREYCQKWAQLHGNVITAHHAAIAKKAGTIDFYSTGSSISGGLFPNALTHLTEEARASVKWTKVTVPAHSLDALYAKTPPDFIKMDIEGAEGEALQGATHLLKARRTTWFIELHNFEGGWPAWQVIKYMRKNYYSNRELAPSRHLFTPMSGVQAAIEDLKRFRRWLLRRTS